MSASTQDCQESSVADPMFKIFLFGTEMRGFGPRSFSKRSTGSESGEPNKTKYDQVGKTEKVQQRLSPDYILVLEAVSDLVEGGHHSSLVSADGGDHG